MGIIPPGQATEVYVPLQVKSQRKANLTTSAEDKAENTSVTILELIPEAKISPLTDLVQKYGDKLRIAVDPETSFAAITGSHIRVSGKYLQSSSRIILNFILQPSKLSPMVYAALQFITRARESGISVTDLGKKTNYDQKTCFYLVQQLLSLDLVYVNLEIPGT